MPKSPDRPRDPAGKTPRKTYRLESASLAIIDRIMARYHCSATDALRIALGEFDKRLDREDARRP
jgi:hypothetical protein